MPKQYPSQKIFSAAVHPTLASDGLEVIGVTFQEEATRETPDTKVYIVTVTSRVTISNNIKETPTEPEASPITFTQTQDDVSILKAFASQMRIRENGAGKNGEQ